MKKFRIKPFISLLLVLMVLTSAFATSAFAAISDPLVDPNRPVTLTVHKYDVPNEDETLFQPGDGSEIPETSMPAYKPLKNARFSAYLVTPSNKSELEALVGGIDTPFATSATETIDTDINGLGKFTALPQGRYLIVETYSPDSVVKKTANFMVDLPYTNADMKTWNYNVHVYPKNYTVLGSVELTKTIDSGSMPAGLFAKFELQQYINGRYTTMSQYADLRTDDDGKIRVDGLIKGQYQFVETVAPVGYGINSTPIKFEITKNTAAEVVAVSMDNSELPQIDKFVSSDDGATWTKSEGIDWTKPAKWNITPNVPSNIADYTKYVVTDIVDNRLTILEDSIVVYADGRLLSKGATSDYNVTIERQIITVTFIDDVFVGGKTSLLGTQNLSIQFKTTIKKDSANLGYDIPNDSILEFNNGTGTEQGSYVDVQPEVHTGGVKLEKVDASNHDIKLGNAKFAIYATEADALAGVNPIRTAISTDQGAFEFTGLPYGSAGEASASKEYWIVETQAPAGYHLNKTPLKVEVDDNSYSDEQTIIVENVYKLVLPLTGAQGIMFFAIGGLLLIGLATSLIVVVKKSSKKTN